jgi:hypothetical protein
MYHMNASQIDGQRPVVVFVFAAAAVVVVVVFVLVLFNRIPKIPKISLGVNYPPLACFRQNLRIL